MKSLIAVKFCTFLLIGTSLGQKETQQTNLPKISVTTFTIQGKNATVSTPTPSVSTPTPKPTVPTEKTNPDDNTAMESVENFLYLLFNSTVYLAEEVGELVVNVSSEGITLGETAMGYVANVTTDALGLSDDSGDTTTGKKSEKITMIR